MEKCRCHCHTNKSLMVQHITACCLRCPQCNEVINYQSYRRHVNKCKEVNYHGK